MRSPSLFLSPLLEVARGPGRVIRCAPHPPDAALLSPSPGAPELCPVGSAGRDGAPHSEKSTPWPPDNPTEASLALPRRGAGFLRTCPPGVEGPHTGPCRCSRTFHQSRVGWQTQESLRSGRHQGPALDGEVPCASRASGRQAEAGLGTPLSCSEP